MLGDPRNVSRDPIPVIWIRDHMGPYVQSFYLGGGASKFKFPRTHTETGRRQLLYGGGDACNQFCATYGMRAFSKLRSYMLQLQANSVVEMHAYMTVCAMHTTSTLCILCGHVNKFF